MGKLGVVCKDVLAYFYLEIATWIWCVLYREKILSVLFNYYDLSLKAKIKDILLC